MRYTKEEREIIDKFNDELFEKKCFDEVYLDLEEKQQLVIIEYLEELYGI